MESIPSSLKANFIKDKLILAPMVRINTLPFRELVYAHGCDITFTEEIVAKKLVQCVRVVNDKINTIDYVTKTDNILVLRILPSEKNHLVLQLGASNPDDAVKAAKIVKDDIIGIDLNMGCPKHFSTHGNMGNALLGLPQLAKDILTNLVNNFPDKVISCKIRLLNEKEKFENLVKMIQESGIDYFTVHLRYKDQNSKYPAKWEEIENISKLAKIPFAVNGDIFTPRDLQILTKKKIISGYMLGRGAIHNPNVFNEFKELHEDLNVVEFQKDENEKVNTILDKETPNKEEENKDKDTVQMSTKLSKALERRYNNKKVDIIPLIKEFLTICMKYDNNFGNSKYITLYVLKTHRHLNELFKKIQNCKSYTELFSYFDMTKDYKTCSTLSKESDINTKHNNNK